MAPGFFQKGQTQNQAEVVGSDHGCHLSCNTVTSGVAVSNWQRFGVWNDFHVPAIVRFIRLINELVDVAVSFGLAERFGDFGFVETGAGGRLCRVNTNIDNVFESIILWRCHMQRDSPIVLQEFFHLSHHQAFNVDRRL